MIEINWENIPNKLGVYWWESKNKEVILVSKTKNIKKSMQKYFEENIDTEQKLLISNIFAFGYKVCNSPEEAVSLEEKLIKEHDPKYNFKTNTVQNHPYIEIKISDKITAKVTKKVKQKNSYFFGPFKYASTAKKIIALLSRVELVNHESTSLNKEDKLKRINNFFSGEVDFIKEKLKEDKDSLLLLSYCERFLETHKKIMHDEKNRDIFNFYQRNGVISISIMHIRNGRLWLISNFINKDINPNERDLFETFLNMYYLDKVIPDFIHLPFNLSWKINISNKIVINPNQEETKLVNFLGNDALIKFENNMDVFSNKLANFNFFSNFLKFNSKNKKFRYIEMIDYVTDLDYTYVCFAMFDNGVYEKKLTKTYRLPKNVDLEKLINVHFAERVLNKTILPDLVILPNNKFLNNLNKDLTKIKNHNIKILSIKLNEQDNIETLESMDNKFLISENKEINLFVNKMRKILLKQILQQSEKVKWED